MSSIGWGEIVLLGVAALFVLGPERLPDLAKDAAGGLRRVRGAVSVVRRQVSESLGDDLSQLADPDIRRYQPQTFVREHLLGEDDGPRPTSWRR